jgi:hypothetical protein
MYMCMYRAVPVLHAACATACAGLARPGDTLHCRCTAMQGNRRLHTT